MKYIPGFKFMPLTFLLSVFLINLLFCSSNTNNNLEAFFYVLEEKIQDEKIMEEFRNAPKDSIDEYSYMFSDEFASVYYDADTHSSFSRFLKHNNILIDTDEGYLVLLYAFHSTLNHENYHLEKIRSDVQRYLQKRGLEEEKLQKQNRLELMKIIQTNNQTWHKGDTINLIFPVFRDSTGSGTLHPQFPKTLDYSNYFNDTLFLKGVLLRKRTVIPTALELDPTDSLRLIFFDLKLIDISDTSVYILGKAYKPGDTLAFDLETYGRLIK